jgi:hypothetical protein
VQADTTLRIAPAGRDDSTRLTRLGSLSAGPSADTKLGICHGTSPILSRLKMQLSLVPFGTKFCVAPAPRSGDLCVATKRPEWRIAKRRPHGWCGWTIRDCCTSVCERGRTNACVPQRMAGPPPHARHTDPRLTLHALGPGAPGYARVAAIGDETSTRWHDVAGSTEARTSTCDVLVQRVGVCRDSAHLALALCRAWCLLACSIAGDAVGLMPPDFHGLFEAALGRAGTCVTPRGWLP